MTDDILEIVDAAHDRYGSLRLIPWWNHERLRSASVLVVGAGALGNEVLKNLALLGVGRVTIVDMDVVEASNLARSVLFRMSDVGLPKAEVAASRVRELNPDVATTVLQGDVSRTVGLGVFRGADVVFGCLDNRAARLAVNRACWRTSVPYVDGAMDVLMGLVRVIVPPHGACYECTMEPQDYALMNLRYSCPTMRPGDVMVGRAPTTPTTASIVAGLQVQEGVKLLHGLPTPAGKGIYFNGQTCEMSVIDYTRREECGSHETFEEIFEIPSRDEVATVGALLERGRELAGEPCVLVLDRELVRGFHCPACGRVEAVFRDFDDVVPDQVSCPACGTDRLPDVANRLAGPSVESLCLSQIGIPVAHIVRIEGRSGREVFLEFREE